MEEWAQSVQFFILGGVVARCLLPLCDVIVISLQLGTNGAICCEDDIKRLDLWPSHLLHVQQASLKVVGSTLELLVDFALPLLDERHRADDEIRLCGVSRRLLAYTKKTWYMPCYPGLATF